MITQPTQPMDTPRDPHLPPPAVVDWLLEQTWPGEIPETRIDFQGQTFRICFYLQSLAILILTFGPLLQ
jgi:hypothetical protein